MLRITVSGAAGKMGKMVISAIDGDERFSLAGAIEVGGHGALGKDAGTNAGVSEAGVKISDDIPSTLIDSDVVIDFSSPKWTLLVVEHAARLGRAVVTGTTGLSDAERDELKRYSRKIPIVSAPNMSVGVNLLFTLCDEAARVLGDDYDVEIVEAHHHEKVDAPSGTAKRLFEIVSAALGRDPKGAGIYGRSGIVGKRTKNEIGVFAVRAGDIVGEHTVIFGGVGERIELTHRAHSRMTFVRGALRAGEWIAGRAPGLYSMQDVLGSIK